MKAVKINMNENQTAKTMKALITGSGVNIMIILIMTVVVSLFLVVSGNLFESVAGYIMLVPLLIGGYSGGYTAARIKKSGGLMYGVLSSVIVFIFMLIIGFATGSAEITYMLLLKALALMLPSAIGGVKGVNKKEKLKI